MRHEIKRNKRNGKILRHKNFTGNMKNTMNIYYNMFVRLELVTLDYCFSVIFSIAQRVPARAAYRAFRLVV